MKRSTLKSVAALIAFCFMLGVGNAYAGSGTGGPGKGIHQNWDEEGGPGPGMHEKKVEKKGFDEEKMYKDLGLTTEQIEKLKVDKEENMKLMDELQEKLHQQREALREELDKEQSDKANLDQITSEMKKLMAEMVDQRVNSVLKVKGVFSPEQYKKFSEKRKEHFNEMNKKKEKMHKKAIKGKAKAKKTGEGK